MRRAAAVACLLVSLSAAPPAEGRAQSTRVVYRAPDDTLAYGYRLFLPAGPPRGLVVLLANWGNTFHEFDRQRMTLPGAMQARGVATLQLNNTPWRSNYFDAATLAAADSIIAAVMRAHGVPAGRVVVGGLQMGGSAALKYAQRCAEGACAAGASPAGVFAVDPVLDLTRFWRAYDVYLKRPGGRTGARAAVKGALERELGGTPDAVPEAYRRNSVYLHFEADGGRAPLLRQTAVRLYMEPDVQWYLRTWEDDYLTSNAADIAGLALFLRRLGHGRAELLTPTGRATLPDGRPSPHAWHLVDEAELALWIGGLLPAAP